MCNPSQSPTRKEQLLTPEPTFAMFSNFIAALQGGVPVDEVSTLLNNPLCEDGLVALLVVHHC